MIPFLLLAGTALLFGKYAHHAFRVGNLGTMSPAWLVEYRRQAHTTS
jgi:hypothetical protein